MSAWLVDSLSDVCTFESIEYRFLGPSLALLENLFKLEFPKSGAHEFVVVVENKFT